MTSSQPTVIPTITSSGFAGRMGALIPRGWANDAAKQPGGNLYALLETLGSQIAFLLSGVQYAQGSTRIQTAVAPELDLASEDFFGDSLPRLTGMSDEAFQAYILANLPPTGATRDAIVRALTILTGVVPRVIEPWNTGDTGCYDTKVSFYDVDSTVNPFVWADTGARYQGFIITPAPPVTGLGDNPFYTYDDSGFYDANLYYIEITTTTINSVYNLINRTKVYGTIVWVQIGNVVRIDPT